MIDLPIQSEIPIGLEKRPRDKVTKISLAVAAIALLGCFLFGILYFSTNGQEDKLTVELLAKENRLANHQTVDKLEDELAISLERVEDARRSYEEARLTTGSAHVIDDLNNGSILEAVIELANDNDLDIISISTSPGLYEKTGESDEQGGGVRYNSLNFQLQIAGELSDLESYIVELEQGELKTVNIDSMSITGADNSYTTVMDFVVIYP